MHTYNNESSGGGSNSDSGSGGDCDDEYELLMGHNVAMTRHVGNVGMYCLCNIAVLLRRPICV